MPRRFQFSLGRLLTAVALFAVAIWLLRMVYTDGNGLAITLVPVVIGSAVGTLLRHPGAGVVFGWCCLPIWWLVIVVALSCRE